MKKHTTFPGTKKAPGETHVLSISIRYGNKFGCTARALGPVLGGNGSRTKTALSQVLGHNSACGHTLLGKVLGKNGARIKNSGNAGVHLRQGGSLVLSGMFRCKNHGSDFTTLKYYEGKIRHRDFTHRR